MIEKSFTGLKYIVKHNSISSVSYSKENLTILGDTILIQWNILFLMIFDLFLQFLL
jgi:hypothetical protein